MAAGKIPNIPTSYFTAPGTSPVYPKGIDPTSPKVCSGTDQCMIEGDIWAGPDGTFASAFDDGPTDVSCFNFFCQILVSVTVFKKSVYPRPCAIFAE